MNRKLLAAVILVFAAAAGNAQTVTHNAVASQFNQWKAYGSVNLVVGANTFVAISPCSQAAGGANFYAVQASTPVYIHNAGSPSTDEIVTPTAVVQGSTCTVTLTVSNAHPTPWYITSGTYGLQEAINANSLSGQLLTVALDQTWFQANGTWSTIYGAAGNANTSIIDTTVSPISAFGWNGTHYLGTYSILGTAAPTLAAGAAAGTSPTVSNSTDSLGTLMTANVTTGTATTTGTLFTETVGTAPPLSRAVNCTVQSIGANNFPVPITLSSSGAVLTATVASAPTASTAYVFSVHCN